MAQFAYAKTMANRPDDALAVMPQIAVVIPSYCVSAFIIDVVDRIGPDISHIFVVDDCCPEASGQQVEECCLDPRVTVIRRRDNGGVGAATMSGYLRAIEAGADVIIKMDGDGQMDPQLIRRFAQPILDGQADYTKGNRFFHLEDLRQMPWVRQFGNAGLSLLAKFSTGYWDIVDPTNGFTCVHARVAEQLPFKKISNRYFFESDMLFRLNLLNAVVVDIPMTALYGDEVSGLSIKKIIFEFSRKHLVNFSKRIFYKYFLREFNVGTIELIVGVILCFSGGFFGAWQWFTGAEIGRVATSGTVMIAAIPIILGTQLLIASLTFDVQNVPRRPLHPRL